MAEPQVSVADRSMLKIILFVVNLTSEFAQNFLAHKKEEGLFIGSAEVTQKKKSEVRVLVVSQHRLYVIKPGDSKVSMVLCVWFHSSGDNALQINQDSHLLDLVEVRSADSKEVSNNTLASTITHIYTDATILSLKTLKHPNHNNSTTPVRNHKTKSRKQQQVFCLTITKSTQYIK